MSIARLEHDTVRDIDPYLIIIGAGPAGLVIASQFLASGKTVVVLESGSRERNARNDELNAAETVGQTRSPQDEVRCRILGGASAIWTGRCGLLDAVDFDARPWVAHSGWPFDLEALRPYYQRAGRYLGIPPTLPAEEAVHDLFQPFDCPAWDSSLLEPVLWQFSNSRSDHADLIRQFTASSLESAEGVGVLQHSGAPVAVNLANHLRGPIEASQTVHVFTNATVDEIEATSEGQVTGVRVLTAGGQAISLPAARVVLAAGGVENPRLLLASRSIAKNGLGNERGQVGRYLTDHAFVQVGLFKGAAGAAVRRRMGTRWHPNRKTGDVCSLGLRLSAEAQRRNGLLNAALHIAEFGSRGSALRSLADAVKSIKTSPGLKTLAELAGALTRPVGLAQASYDRFVMKRPPLSDAEETVVGCVFEQELKPESRIMLSEQTNWLGQPLAKIDWRLSEQEYATSQFAAVTFLNELDRLAIPRPLRPDWLDADFETWKSPLVDLAHPSCTTRMSTDPASGVVDENCKVHGVEGLYVAGSSVFATNGHMNPTHTIIALSLRLADHLKARDSSISVPGKFRSADNRPVRLGFIGGGNRVTTVYHPALNALGPQLEVVGAVTQSEDGAARIAKSTGWHATTDLQTFVSKEKPELLSVVVPPDVIDAEYPRFIELGIPLLLETPFCWNERAGRKLQKKISATNLLIGVAEQFPFYPEAQLRQKLIKSGRLGRILRVENHFALYDYHAMAVARAHIGRDKRPAGAQGLAPVRADDARSLRGMIQMEDGGIIAHDYSDIEFDSQVGPEGQISVVGSTGSIAGSEVTFSVGKDAVHRALIERVTEGDDLISISVEAAGERMVWSNPYVGYCLSDEQIAVAEVLNGMISAVRDSGVPPYRTRTALEDVELMRAMCYSANRGGKAIPYPPNPLREKARSKASKLSQKVISRFRPR